MSTDPAVQPTPAPPGTITLDGTVGRGEFTLTADLGIEPGTVTAVLGPNGSGKSTLLLSLAGLLPLTTGTITVTPADTPASTGTPSRSRSRTAYPQDRTWADEGTHRPPQQRSVGLVLAEPMLFPHLDLLDNVAFGPRSRGIGRAAARARACSELTRVGLLDLARRKPSTVSSGQAQRAALARALATDPDLLLLDEPLSALDPQTRSRTRADLRRRLDDFPGGTVVVTHDPLDALTLADRLLFLDGGRIVQVDTPAAAIRRPRNAYVARIVGLNLLSGVARVGEQVVVEVDGGVVVTAEDPAQTPDGSQVWLTIDPAAVALYDAPAAGSTRNTWAVTVREVTIAGQRARVVLTGAVPLTAEVTTASVAELGLVAGRRLWAGVKATEVTAYPA